jgi:hypothetical protein
MAREHEGRCGAAAAGPKIVDGAEAQVLDREAGPREQLADQGLAAGIGRGYGRAADQLLRKRQRIHDRRFFMGLRRKPPARRNATDGRLQ